MAVTKFFLSRVVVERIVSSIVLRKVRSLSSALGNSLEQRRFLLMTAVKMIVRASVSLMKGWILPTGVLRNSFARVRKSFSGRISAS